MVFSRSFLTMPTSCCVVGCTNRHCKDAPYRFYRFPKDSDRRQRWIAAIRRMNIDGSAWQPSAGDRVCAVHFTSGEKNNNPTHPGFVPTLNMTGEVFTAVASSYSSRTMSAELNIVQLEKISSVVSSKKKQHKLPASLSLEELSLLSILILVLTASPSGSLQPS